MMVVEVLLCGYDVLGGCLGYVGSGVFWVVAKMLLCAMMFWVVSRVFLCVIMFWVVAKVFMWVAECSGWISRVLLCYDVLGGF